MTTISMTALDTTVRLVGPGETVGEDTVPDGQIGVLLASTDGDQVVVFGTAATLRSLVFSGMTAPIPADVPLFDDDGYGTDVVGIIVAQPPAPNAE